MKVTVGDFFLYVKFQTETGDFRGSPNKIEQFKAAIPEEERDYNPDKKIWYVEDCPYSWKVIEELGGAGTPKEKK